ncbi:hypothetical protein [Halegenticoccus soli]|uniref:hypothetical protein n=1 Tax=Halegenticoccus soli TaxID=1985678 RepID=UPI000C6D05B7|nr:hypothetical protein [Halegenticoccus soli]
MRPLGSEAFGRELRRLDAAALARFVADLWRARGWEATVEGDLVRVERDSPAPERRTLAVARRIPPPDALARFADGDVDAVVTSARVPEDRRSRVSEGRRSRAPESRRAGDSARPAIFGAEALHEMALYAVDRDEFDALCRRYFGRSGLVDPPSDPDEPSSNRDGSPHARSPARALTIAAVVALVLVLGAAAAVHLDVVSVDSTRSPELVGPSGGPLSPNSRPALTSGAPSEGSIVGCPSPPRAAHPALLRPAVVSETSAFGLDGWTLRSAANVTSFHGRTDLAPSHDPEVRHVASYASPEGTTYRVALDRWRSPSLARTIGEETAADRLAVLVWGRYTVAVSGYSDAGRLDGERHRDRARALLAAVSKPNGSRLGRACVDRLLAEPPSDGSPTAETTVATATAPTTATTPTTVSVD